MEYFKNNLKFINNIILQANLYNKKDETTE